MAQVRFTNNAKTTLNGAINNSVTTIVVTDGGVLPDITGGDWFYLTLEDNVLTREIVKVTARSVHTLTVVRGQDGTAASSWATGVKAENRITMAAIDEIAAAVSGITPGSAFLALVDDTTNAALLTTLGINANVQTWLATPSSANLLAAVTDETGTGALVFATSPTLVTPLLGTPTSGVLTNCTGLPLASITGLGSGVATWLATPSSANLLAAMTDETGTGALVFGTAPTMSALTLTGINTATNASGFAWVIGKGTPTGTPPTWVTAGDTLLVQGNGTSNAIIQIYTSVGAAGALHFSSPDGRGLGSLVYDHGTNIMNLSTDGVLNLYGTSTIVNASVGGGADPTDAAFVVKAPGASNSGPYIVLQSTSASPTAGDVWGFRYFGKDSAANDQVYGSVNCAIVDPTSTSEDSELRFAAMVAGSFANRFVLGAAATFSVPVTITGARTTISGTLPWGVLQDTSAGTDAKNWSSLVSGSTLYFQTHNDAFSSGTTWLSVTRSGNTPVLANFAVALSVGGDPVMTRGATETVTGVKTHAADINFSGYRAIKMPTGNAYGRAQGYYNWTGGAHDHYILSCNWNVPAGTVDNAALGTNYIDLRAVNGSNGQIVFGTGSVNTAPSMRAYIDNTGMTATDFFVSSDERLKRDFIPFTNALEKVRQLRTGEYTRISTGKREVGFMAQDFERAGEPLFVEKSMDYKTLRYHRTPALLAAAIKELLLRVEALEARQ